MTLSAEVQVARPGHTVDVALESPPGEVVAVVGPNGSGKTTVLRALAGLTPLTGGRVAYDGRTWEEPSARVRLTAPERRIGIVPQDVLLFPHLSALDNVAFGMRARGGGRRASRAAATGWLERLGVDRLASRRPHELSGGQAARVALARALAADPVLLLLDEPFAALDVGAAMTLRLELARHLDGFAGVALLVTHDALDALTVSDRVLVLEDGRVVQDGAPAEVARRPRSEHVARLVGLNVLRGHSHGTVVTLPGGGQLVTSTPYDGAVEACFSPAAVTLAGEQSSGSARNQWAGRIASAAPHGAAVRLHVDAAGGLIADVTPESVRRLGLEPGREVWASVKATEIAVHRASQGTR